MSTTPLSLQGARGRFGARIADEELLLRLPMPGDQVDASDEHVRWRRGAGHDGAR